MKGFLLSVGGEGCGLLPSVWIPSANDKHLL